jgi:hypothetical protein
VRAALILLAAALGACSLFDADTPSRACRTDNDCFQAQGESCNLVTGQCGPRPDAGPPDAESSDVVDADVPDADPPDAAVLDADLPDAESSDVVDAAAGGAP